MTGPQSLAFAGLRSVAQKGQINAVQADAAGNVYLLINQGDGVRLLKTDNAAATILAQTQVGASGDAGVAMALDAAGDVYVTGTTTSTALKGTAGAAIPARTDSSTNSFVAEFDTNLNLLWLSFTGGSRIAASAIAVTADAVFVTGITYATNLPVTSTAIQQAPALGSSQNGFVERFSTTGAALVYATYVTGASGDTTPAAIAADANDNAYLGGFTTASGFPTIAALVPAMPSNPSGFLTKLDPAGDAITASTFIPGAGLSSLAYDAVSQTLLASGSIALGQFPVATVASPLVPATYQVVLRLPLSLGAVNSSTLIAPGTQSSVAAGAGETAWVDGTLSEPLLPLAPLSSLGNGFTARVNARGAVDQTARFGGLPNGNASFASLPATIAAIAIDQAGEALIGGAIQPTASSGLLASETYELPLFNTPTAALPSAITDAELTAAGCNGSLCAGSAAYLAKIAPVTGTSLAFSTGAAPWITLRNLGSTEADNLTLTASGATLSTNCPSILYAGAECDLLLSGSGPGSVTVSTTNAGTETINLPAFAAPPTTIVFSPRELDFGIQTSMSTAASRTITVSNLGTASQTFTSSIYGSVTSKTAASPFTETSSDCPTIGSNTTKVLAAGATCHITIAFTAYGSSGSDGALQADWSIGAGTVALTGYSQAAALSVSATEIDFGMQYANGIRLPRYLYVSNASANAVAHSTVSLAAGSAFTVVDSCPLTMPAGTVCQIRIDYAAASTTSNDAATLALDDGLSVLITGKTLPPQTVGGATANPNLAVTPVTLAFSSPVVVTGTSSAQTVAVTNSGASAFPLSLAITGDFTDVTSCTATLAAGATCAVAITFAPTQPGVRQGTLAVTAGAGTSPISVALSGTATAILPENNGDLDFGSVTIGEPSPQFYKIAQPISSLRVVTTGPFAAVVVQDAGYGPGSPPVSAYSTSVTAACPDCYLGLNFMPTAVGPQTGTVTLTSAAGGSPYTLMLSGTGAAVTGLVLTPSVQNFGTVPVGSTSGGFAFTLTNLLASGSAAPLTSATTGDFAAASGSGAQACGATLAYTASCTVQVAFSPTATGARSGTLTFSSGSATATSALTGTAVAAPSLAVSPLSLTFASGSGAAATQQTVTLTNSSSTSLQIGSPSVGTSSFGWSSNCTTLVAGSSCGVTVTFTPGNAAVTDTLLIAATTAGAGSETATYTVALNGSYTSSTAGLAIVPAIASYGSANVDTQGITEQFTITNTTQKSFAIGLDIPRQFALVGAPCGALAAGASCSFSVQFVPLTNGTVPGSIVVRATPSDGSATLTSIAYVEGYGVGQGTLTVSGGLIVSNVFNFGQVASGQTASQTFSLTNSGGEGASPMTVRRVSSAPPFLSTTSCASALAVGQSCAVTATYAPMNQVAIGTQSPSATNDAGMLTIESDSLSSPVVLNLTGQAGPLAVSGPGTVATLATFTLSQGSLTFPSATVGDVSAAQTITLTNTGTQPMQVASISAPVDFSIESTCTTVAARGSCTISVASTPQTAGTHLAALSILSNATTSLEFVTLISTATASPLQITPSSLAFSSVALGSSAILPVQVTNAGATPIVFTSVGVTGDYTVAGTCPAGGGTLAPGASCTEQVTFTPSATGTRGGVLSFTTSASTQPLTVALSGVGTKVQLVVSPALLSFGNVAVGVSSNLQLTLTNNGNAPLSGITLTINGDYIVSSACGVSTLAPGSSCAVQITFTPRVAGVRNGALMIASSDPASPAMVPLSGTGIAANGGFTLTVDNATEFVTSGKPATYNLTITPTGGFAGMVALTCAPAGTVQYVSCSILPPSVMLAGAAQSSVVTINTVTSIVDGSVPMRPGSRIRDTFLCLLGPCVFFVWRDRGKLRRHRLLLAALFFCAASLFASGCGGNQDFNLRYASAGSYEFVVTGASTTGAPATQSLTVKLGVSPR